MHGFPAVRDISHRKLAHLSISKHSTTASLASGSCCQMPSLFLKLCIQGTPFFFFLLEILSKKNTMFWVAWPKFSCTFASLPNFLFLAKQFIILLVLQTQKDLQAQKILLGFYVFSEKKTHSLSHNCPVDARTETYLTFGSVTEVQKRF